MAAKVRNAAANDNRSNPAHALKVLLAMRRWNKKPPSSRQEPAVARKSRAAAAPVRAFITLERIDPRGESSAALTKRTAARGQAQKKGAMNLLYPRYQRSTCARATCMIRGEGYLQDGQES